MQLEDTEMDHAYYLEKQLKLIGLVGLHNYQQSQIKPGNLHCKAVSHHRPVTDKKHTCY